jgi:hypothetical protein
MQAQAFIVNALDADGNTIVGVGAPTLAVAMTSGSGWTIANPTTTLPNTFTITPATTQNSSAALQITASFSDSTCSLAGAVCTATFNVKNDLPTLFVAACNATNGCGNGDAVLVYAPPYTGTPTTITSSIDAPAQLALDGSQNLYVAKWRICMPVASARMHRRIPVLRMPRFRPAASASKSRPPVQWC